MAEQSVAGRCHCGSVAFTVFGEIEAFYCHCQSCRLNSGAPFVAWGRVSSDSFRLIRGTLKEFNSSKNVSWFFCGKCGTGIQYKNSESEPDIDFLLATLTSGREIMPAYHIQVEEKLAWIQIADGLPQYSRWRTDES